MSSQNRNGQNYNSIKVQKGYLFLIYSSGQSQALCLFSIAAYTLKQLFKIFLNMIYFRDQPIPYIWNQTGPLYPLFKQYV